MAKQVNFMVGGEAGQGVQSVGIVIAKTFARGGYNIFADQDYESRIRGGHNFFRIRVREGEVGAVIEPVDILIALNKESIDLHRNELTAKGIIIYDNEKIKDVENKKGLFGLPMERLAEEKAGNKLMTNTVALGAIVYMAGYDIEILNKVLRDFFDAGESGEGNVKAAQAGFDYTRENFKGDSGYRLSPISKGEKMLLNGHDAISLGAIAAGCKFMAAYPMTPASPIMEYFASKSKDFDLVMVHAEDEISAVNMAVGASFAGVRAMTATSGSGFCLMVEGLGLAAITETPIVMIDAQRPGPAVGLPTRTEQADLLFMLHAHHGDFPRVLLAPANIEDAFWLTIKAFNLTEKYQLPVIILTDHYLATSYATVDKFDLSKVIIDRGLLFPQRDSGDGEYKRHEFTESGISPRAFPGQGKALVVTDSDEHDEAGHLTESAEIRTAIVDKRWRKLPALKGEIAHPRVYGADKAEITLVGWGSTYGALREAVDILREEGVNAKLLHISEIWPFPSKAVVGILDNAKRTYAVESNATGQFARLIRAETGREVNGKILRYDGRPITPAYIVEHLKKEMK